MEGGWTQELLNWVNGNPGWAAFIVFAVAFFESLVLVGIILPGIMILFGIGALIGLGVVELLPVWIAASSGAFFGDSVSYALGYRNRSHLLDIWPFSRYPGLMDRGIRFFDRYGVRSVVAGRFIGPLRPVIPAVAGIMHMPPGRFVSVDLLACICWAPAFLLPGWLFGASLEVAAEYTGRLAVLLVIALFALWSIWWLLRSIYEPLASRSARWMRHGIRWTRRHPVLGRVTGPLLDPAQPELLSVSILGVLLVVIFWGLVLLLFLSPFASQPVALDQAVQQWTLSVRNHLADPIMVAISQLSRWQVTLLSSAAIFFWLMGARRTVAAFHWLVAIGGGWLTQVLLAWGLRATPQVLELSESGWRSPSSAMSLSTVVFSFFAVMIAREVSRKHRQWPYLVAGLLLMLLLLSRLYLGLEWLSGALLGVLLGLLWTVVVGLAYRQRALRPFSGAIAALIFYGSITALCAWQIHENTAREIEALQMVVPGQWQTEEEWWTGGWQQLPRDRTQAPSVRNRQFNAQVALPPALITEKLGPLGWLPVPESDWRWLIQALNPEPDEASLPLLGRAFEGRSEALLLAQRDPRDQRLHTLRMWDSGLRLQPSGAVVYLVQFSDEQLVQRLGVFSHWRPLPIGRESLAEIRLALSVADQKETGDGMLLIRASR